jgi:hypothetical protein
VPSDVAAVTVKAPNILRPRNEPEARDIQALFTGVRQIPASSTVLDQRIEFIPPVGPGEECSGRINVVVPLSLTSRGFRPKARLIRVIATDSTGLRIEKDTVKLKCVPPPVP